MVWIEVNGLDRIVREFGQDSEEVIEAVNILKMSLNEIEEALNAVYGDKVCIYQIQIRTVFQISIYNWEICIFLVYSYCCVRGKLFFPSEETSCGQAQRERRRHYSYFLIQSWVSKSENFNFIGTIF